jgi:hypothetical protein
LECHAASRHHLLEFGFFYGTIKPWFHNSGKTCCCIHHTFSWGSQLAGHLHHQHCATNKFSGAVAEEKRRLLQGEFHTHILYFIYCFAFTLFLLASFYQKYKKN